MTTLQYPQHIDDLRSALQECRDPFFHTLQAIIARDEKELTDIINGIINERDPRAIGTFPAVLLHPATDLSFIRKYARAHPKEGRILAYYAQEALAQAQKDTTPPPKRLGFSEEFRRFRQDVGGSRGNALRNIARATPSVHPLWYDPRGFPVQYQKYRYVIYRGRTTP